MSEITAIDEMVDVPMEAIEEAIRIQNVNVVENNIPVIQEQSVVLPEAVKESAHEIVKERESLVRKQDTVQEPIVLQQTVKHQLHQQVVQQPLKTIESSQPVVVQTGRLQTVEVQQPTFVQTKQPVVVQSSIPVVVDVPQPTVVNEQPIAVVQSHNPVTVEAHQLVADVRKPIPGTFDLRKSVVDQVAVIIGQAAQTIGFTSKIEVVSHNETVCDIVYVDDKDRKLTAYVNKGTDGKPNLIVDLEGFKPNERECGKKMDALLKYLTDRGITVRPKRKAHNNPEGVLRKKLAARRKKGSHSRDVASYLENGGQSRTNSNANTNNH